MLSAIQGYRLESNLRGSGGYANYVKAAEEHILVHLGSTIRIADIAEVVDISVPTLNRPFADIMAWDQIAFAKRRRLDRVRVDFLKADPKLSSVTAIAREHGFWHLSQLAADYKNAFHETPSDALRRS